MHSFAVWLILFYFLIQSFIHLCHAQHSVQISKNSSKIVSIQFICNYTSMDYAHFNDDDDDGDNNMKTPAFMALFGLVWLFDGLLHHIGLYKCAIAHVHIWAKALREVKTNCNERQCNALQWNMSDCLFVLCSRCEFAFMISQCWHSCDKMCSRAVLHISGVYKCMLKTNGNRNMVVNSRATICRCVLSTWLYGVSIVSFFIDYFEIILFFFFVSFRFPKLFRVSCTFRSLVELAIKCDLIIFTFLNA